MLSCIDTRCTTLGGMASGWMAPGLLPIKHSGSVKAVDCRRLLWHAGDYVWYNLFGEKQSNVEAWLDTLRKVELSTADADNEDACDEISGLKMLVARGLTNYENSFPPQSHCVVAHEVMHVPDCIYRWNSVRNYWAFHLERYGCDISCTSALTSDVTLFVGLSAGSRTSSTIVETRT
jgi:hypothetical protein